MAKESATHRRRRRRFGTFFLAAAAGLLIAGLTVLESRLKGLAFVIYWLICFACTGLAMLIALWDMRAIRHDALGEQREMMEETLTDIDGNEANERSKSSPRPGERG